MEPLRVALVGVGRRGTGVWLPVIRALGDRASLVAVGNRGAPRGREAADSAGVPWFTDTERLLDEAEPHVLVAAVNPSAISNVSLSALERGISVITETPLALTLEDADRMIETAKRTGARLEVAENFYRAPDERLKGMMLAEGVFGKIWRTFNDHRTHNYPEELSDGTLAHGPDRLRQSREGGVSSSHSEDGPPRPARRRL